MLVEITLWTYLFALGVGLLATIIAYLRPNAETLKKAILLGLFLALADFVFENFGAQAGLWTSFGSPLFLWAVPIQVVFIAILAGMAYHLIMQPRADALYVVSTSLLLAMVGVGIEGLLLDYKLLTYANGWTSVHAMASYFVTFVVLNWANLKLSGRRVFHEDSHDKTHKTERQPALAKKKKKS
ncbi:hypothetical protein HY572_00750 [Candidatus Micrarchaeota archaeon]|nr:hypothetical protein [Candidatus Micrarchaeota archaeon]